MSKSKYDFISELLEDKKLTSIQKDRILKLVSNELKTDFSSTIEIKSRLKEVELKLGIVKQEVGESKNQDSEKNTKLAKYIYPNKLHKFLFEYNQNPILKTTCHVIDDDELENILSITNSHEYNFDKHYNEIIKAYNDLENSPEFKDVDYKLKALIRGYLTGEDKKGIKVKWASVNTINWKCNELLVWVKNNPEKVPNPDDKVFEHQYNTEFTINARETNIQTFSEFVIYFKKLFHIKYDNSLKYIIENVNREKKWDEKIEFILSEDFKTNIEFFTDIDKLKQAYNRILEIIIEVSSVETNSKPIVKLSLVEIGKNIEFSIIHTNSIFKKSPTNLIQRLGTKHSNLINRQINGLCDLILNAEFEGDIYASINLWDEKSLIDIEGYRVSTKLNYFKGVEHKMIFRK